MPGPSDPAPNHTVAHSWEPSPLGVSVPDSPILSSADTARLMGFPTREALAKARRAGRLPIQMFTLPGRRGWFATREEVFGWLRQSLNRGGGPMS